MDYRCTSCSFDNPSKSRFCAKCGASLEPAHNRTFHLRYDQDKKTQLRTIDDMQPLITDISSLFQWSGTFRGLIQLSLAFLPIIAIIFQARQLLRLGLRIDVIIYISILLFSVCFYLAYYSGDLLFSYFKRKVRDYEKENKLTPYDTLMAFSMMPHIKLNKQFRQFVHKTWGDIFHDRLIKTYEREPLKMVNGCKVTEENRCSFCKEEVKPDLFNVETECPICHTTLYVPYKLECPYCRTYFTFPSDKKGSKTYRCFYCSNRWGIEFPESHDEESVDQEDKKDTA